MVGDKRGRLGYASGSVASRWHAVCSVHHSLASEHLENIPSVGGLIIGRPGCLLMETCLGRRVA